MSPMEQPDREELYLLRVQDKGLAEKIKDTLSAQEKDRGNPPSIDLRFTSSNGADIEARTGELTFEGNAYPVRRQDLPTVVECFKTYDHVNLVKSADVGQVILVPELGAALPEGVEARNGVTPPMKDARKRRFRKSRDIEPALMRQVEDAVLLINSGLAPEGYEFEDEEEVYVVADDGRSGSWQPYEPGRAAQTPEPQTRKTPKRRSNKKKGESAEPAASQEGGGRGETPSASRRQAGAPSQSQADGMEIEDI